jgi:tetratricopeptide (TPR) repeat protein
MEKNTLLLVIVAALSGLIGGFLLANSMNRSEMNALRSQAVAPASNSVQQPGKPADDTLSPAEIQSKIDEADKNADNFAFQKNLGIGLYRYAAMKQDEKIMVEAERILARAAKLDGKDFDVLVALGNAEFDIGFFKKENAGFEKARATYTKALEIKPNDLDVQTDLGLTYFLTEPADNAKAAATLEKVIAADPKHSRSMQFLVQSYTKLGRIADAEKTLAKLKEIEPSNAQLSELTSQLANAKGGAK